MRRHRDVECICSTRSLVRQVPLQRPRHVSLATRRPAIGQRCTKCEPACAGAGRSSSSEPVSFTVIGERLASVTTAKRAPGILPASLVGAAVHAWHPLPPAWSNISSSSEAMVSRTCSHRAAGSDSGLGHVVPPCRRSAERENATRGRVEPLARWCFRLRRRWRASLLRPTSRNSS